MRIPDHSVTVWVREYNASMDLDRARCAADAEVRSSLSLFFFVPIAGMAAYATKIRFTLFGRDFGWEWSAALFTLIAAALVASRLWRWVALRREVAQLMAAREVIES